MKRSNSVFSLELLTHDYILIIFYSIYQNFAQKEVINFVNERGPEGVFPTCELGKILSLTYYYVFFYSNALRVYYSKNIFYYIFGNF